jgi:hypothetical protein
MDSSMILPSSSRATVVGANTDNSSSPSFEWTTQARSAPSRCRTCASRGTQVSS